MRKLVVSVVLLAVCALFGGPAIAADGPEGSTGETSSAPEQDERDDSTDAPAGDGSDGDSDTTDDAPPPSDTEPDPNTTEPSAEEPPAEPGAEDDPAGEQESEDSEAEESVADDSAAEDSPEEDPKDPADEKAVSEGGSVTICHKDDASGTFSRETVSADATVDGHDSHDGDVIPAFDHAGGHYDGKNYDEASKALLEAGCNPADVPLLAADLGIQRLAAARPVAAALAANIVAAAAPAPPTVNNVPICHRTNAEDNPYVIATPSANGVINGHANHTGPIFTPGLKAQGIKWGDIIPPFDFGPGLQFAGLNWTAEGQAIYNNGCVSPLAVPDPDDSDDNDDSDDSDDSDDDSGVLPDAGGASLWTLLVGCLLIVAGTAIVNNRQLGAHGLLAAAFGSPPASPRSTFVPPPTVPEPVGSLQADPSGLTAHRSHWQGAALIALGLAGTAIAIRRARR